MADQKISELVAATSSLSTDELVIRRGFDNFSLQVGLVSSTGSAPIETGSFVKTSSISGTTQTFTKGDGSTYTNEIVSASFAVSASYAVSSSVEITKEITSSYADTASYFNTDPISASLTTTDQTISSSVTTLSGSASTARDAIASDLDTQSSSFASDRVMRTGDTMSGALLIDTNGVPLVIGNADTDNPNELKINRHFSNSGSIKFSRAGVSDDVIIDVNQFEDLQLKYNQATDYKNGDFRIINNTSSVVEILTTSTDVGFNGKLTNVTDPTASQDAATKNYVDTSTANTNYVAVTGDTMTGNLDNSALIRANDGANTYSYLQGAGSQGRLVIKGDASSNEYRILAQGTGLAGRFDIYDQTSAAYRLSILPGGNVGIGQVNPGSKLEVAGTGKFTGNVTIENSAPVLILNDNAGNAVSIVEFQQGGTRRGYVGDFGGSNDDIALAAQNTNGNIVLAPAGTGVVRVETVNTSNPVRITNVQNPTGSQDAATKNYADNVVYTAPVMFSGNGSGSNGDYAAGAKLAFSVDVDTNSAWSDDTYTIPEDGIYEIITSLRTQIETTDRRSAIYKGTGHIRIIENPKGATDGSYRSRTGIGHIITSLVTGDEISVRAFQTTSNYPNVSENGLSIRKIRN